MGEQGLEQLMKNGIAQQENLGRGSPDSGRGSPDSPSRQVSFDDRSFTSSRRHSGSPRRISRQSSSSSFRSVGSADSMYDSPHSPSSARSSPIGRQHSRSPNRRSHRVSSPSGGSPRRMRRQATSPAFANRGSRRLERSKTTNLSARSSGRPQRSLSFRPFDDKAKTCIESLPPLPPNGLSWIRVAMSNVESIIKDGDSIESPELRKRLDAAAKANERLVQFDPLAFEQLGIKRLQANSYLAVDLDKRVVFKPMPNPLLASPEPAQSSSPEPMSSSPEPTSTPLRPKLKRVFTTPINLRIFGAREPEPDFEDEPDVASESQPADLLRANIFEPIKHTDEADLEEGTRLDSSAILDEPDLLSA